MLKFLLIAISLLQISAAQQKAEESPEKVDDELIITSKHLDYDYDQNRAVFNRDVKAINGDTVLNAEKMTCFFSDDNQPYLVICENKVVINRGAHQAKANKATYKIDDKQIILRNLPELFDGKNIIKGRVITFFEDKRVTEVLDAKVTFTATQKASEDKKVKN